MLLSDPTAKERVRSHSLIFVAIAFFFLICFLNEPRSYKWGNMANTEATMYLLEMETQSGKNNLIIQSSEL